MAKWGRVVLVVGGLGLVALLGVRYALQRQLPARLLRTELEKALGHPVRYQSFQLSWDAQLVLDNLQLLDPDGNAFLKIEKTQLDFDRGQALEGKLVLLRLALHNPDLEMSGERWRKLSNRPAQPASARNFPLLIHSLDMRWMDSKGALTWEIKDWRGSFPPVEAGHWKLGLQGKQGESLDAHGQPGQVALRLHHFPVATLATVATGAHYPSLEPAAKVDLEAVHKDDRWDLKADLHSRAFNGPLRLQIGPRNGLLEGVLSTSGGQLPPLGDIGQVQLPFQQTVDGWKVGPARLRWREADWQASAQIHGEDAFSGQLDCRKWPVPSRAGWQAEPADLRLHVKGSVQKQQAEFEATVRLPQVRWEARRLGELRVSARGALQQEGLPQVKWEIASARGKWPGELAWNARSGDLKISFLPLAVETFLPGWKGRLSGQVRRTGLEAWDMRLALPRLQSGDTLLEKGRIQLSGSPPRWGGGATCNGIPLTLSGLLDQPALAGKVPARRLKWPELKGQLAARLALTSERKLRLEVVSHDLRWRGLPLPRVQGALLGSAQGWKSDQLQLVGPAFKLPLTVNGGWQPKSFKLGGQLKSQSLAGLLSNLGVKIAGLEGTATGNFSAGYSELKWTGDLQNLKVASRGLGDWRVSLRKPLGKPALASLSCSALALPGLGPIKAQLEWTGQRPTSIQGRLGPATLHGSLNVAKKSLDFSGRLDKLSIANLPGVLPGSSGWLVADWQARGLWKSPKLDLKGQLQDLKILNHSLGSLPFSAQHQGEQSRASLGPIGLSQLQPLQEKVSGLEGQLQLGLLQVGKGDPQVTASLANSTYQEVALAPLRLSGRWRGLELKDAEIVWQVTPPLKLHGTLGLTPRLSAQLEGQSISLGKLPFQGQAFGNLTCGPGLAFNGELRNLAVSGQKLGQGRLQLEMKERLHVSGQDFDAAKVGLLQQRYPELEGQLSFTIDSDWKKHQGTFKLRKGQWRQRAFPDLTIEGNSEAESWPLSRVEVGVQPPLISTGRMWPATSRLELAGKLAGQSLADLTMLGGGPPPPDLFTRLSGDYTLAAQNQQLNLTFEGRTEQMTYRGVALGEGQLHMRADPDLQGELILQQPLEVGQLADVPAGLKAVLPIRQFLSAIRLRGVRLGGRIDAPTVSPLWTIPQIQVPFP
ncbi:hypothetical protein IV102_33045 [bacterium]|nr:hypothetical protein [bacterium]